MWAALYQHLGTVSLLAQETTSSDPTVGSIISTYGLAAPFVLFALMVVKVLWSRVQKLETELKDAQAVSIEKVIPALLESNRLLKESTDQMARMQSLATRPELDGETWRRILRVLENVEDAQRRERR